MPDSVLYPSHLYLVLIVVLLGLKVFNSDNSCIFFCSRNAHVTFIKQPQFKEPESEFNEFEPWLKSAKNRFQLSAGLNLEKLNTILNGTNHILATAQI